MSRIALVTGANRGLGLEIAHQLARSGARVIVSARDAGKAERAAQAMRDAGLDASGVQLDVTDPASVRRVAEDIRSEHGVLDILINNAGILPEATSESREAIDAGLFRETFETNLLGAVNVTEALLPLLRESSAARIVNISTTMGSLNDQSDPESPYFATVVPAYQASKAALNSLTISLAKLLTDTAIKVNAVCPGIVQTNLTPVNREQAPLTAEAAARVAVRYALIDGDGPSGGFFDNEAAVAW